MTKSPWLAPAEPTRVIRARKEGGFSPAGPSRSKWRRRRRRQSGGRPCSAPTPATSGARCRSGGSGGCGSGRPPSRSASGCRRRPGGAASASPSSRRRSCRSSGAAPSAPAYSPLPYTSPSPVPTSHRVPTPRATTPRVPLHPLQTGPAPRPWSWRGTGCLRISFLRRAAGIPEKYCAQVERRALNRAGAAPTQAQPHEEHPQGAAPPAAGELGFA